MVSALFLPFAEEIIDAAIADETKRAPEAPEQVTQIATQLEVAMAVQDQLTSKVQEIATDLKQKVSSSAHLEGQAGRCCFDAWTGFRRPRPSTLGL